jgi:uncharacterized protein (DUF433 family)
MAALDWSQCPDVESVPGKVSGAWVFKGTRLPVATVIENLEDLSIDEVIEQFDVTREQIAAVLESAQSKGWNTLSNGALLTSRTRTGQVTKASRSTTSSMAKAAGDVADPISDLRTAADTSSKPSEGPGDLFLLHYGWGHRCAPCRMRRTTICSSRIS